MKIVKIDETNAANFSVKEVLQRAFDEINSGEEKTNRLMVITDNSVYAGITKENAIVYLGYYSNSSASVVLDITDTSLCKVSFGFVARGATDTCIGDAVKNSTCMSFVRLGDT